MSQFFIPDPCHENWNSMTPREQGRHCAVCSKTVVDFTAKKETEINSILAEQTGRVCGHFRVEQLNHEAQLKVFRKPSNLFNRNWKYFAMATLGFFSLKKTEAQIRGKIAPIRGDVMPAGQNNASTSTTQVYGMVYMPGGKPAGGASIVISSGGSEIARGKTMPNGSYSFKLRPGLVKNGRIDITVHHGHSASKNVFDLEVPKAANKLNITLEQEYMLKGEIAWVDTVPDIQPLPVVCTPNTAKTNRPADTAAVKNVQPPVVPADSSATGNSSNPLRQAITPVLVVRPEDITLNLYPNPAGTYATVYCNRSTTYKIEVYDEKGALKISKAFYGDRTDIDVSGFARGNYFVQLRDDEGHASTMKLIKQ